MSQIIWTRNLRGRNSRLRKGGKKKVSKPDGPELTVKLVPGQQGSMDELVKGLEQLRLTMVEGFRSQNTIVSGGSSGTGQRCRMGGCRCPEEHAFSYNNCPYTHKLFKEELIQYYKHGHLVLIDGKDLPLPTRDMGGVAQKI